jgi:hypothetical protein
MDGGRSKRFLEQAQLRGKTKRSALRLLKTYIARELFRVLSTGVKGGMKVSHCGGRKGYRICAL